MRQFEPCIAMLDVTLVGIENADSHVKAWHLCPYSNDNVKYATSFEAMQKRIDIVDKIIKQCVTL